MDGYYISPAFMDKVVVHITKNFLNLPNIKVMWTFGSLFLSFNFSWLFGWNVFSTLLPDIEHGYLL